MLLASSTHPAPSTNASIARRASAQGLCAGEPCIKVYVKRKTPDLLRRIPSVIEGHAVSVEETGEIRALDPS